MTFINSDIHRWMSLNSLSQEFILEELQKESGSQLLAIEDDLFESKTGLDVDEAWNKVAQAYQNYFINYEEDVVLVRDNVTRIHDNFFDREFPPFTIDRGDSELPLIYSKYEDTAACLLNLSHEFGHALQIIMSRKSKMQSVWRELCAFLGERLFIDSMLSTDKSLYEKLIKVWNLENKKYMLNDKFTLLTAISYGDWEYNYLWNYPVARMLSGKIYERSTPTLVAVVFSSGRYTPQVLAQEMLIPEIHKCEV